MLVCCINQLDALAGGPIQQNLIHVLCIQHFCGSTYQVCRIMSSYTALLGVVRPLGLRFQLRHCLGENRNLSVIIVPLCLLSQRLR